MPKKPISPYKLAALPEWQQCDIQRREAKAQATLRRGISLKPKPGSRPLQRVRKIQGKVIKRLTQRTGLVPSGKPLKLLGVRGKRLAPKDRQQEASTHILPCCCGCNAHLQPGADGIPGKGLISRAHLESRRFETTRNEDWNNLPACLYLNEWLDRTAGGADAKEDLLRLAQEQQRRLTPEEVQPVLVMWGYYSWVHNERRII